MKRVITLLLIVAIASFGCQDQAKVATNTLPAPTGSEDAPSNQPTGPGSSGASEPFSNGAAPSDSPSGERTIPYKNLPPDLNKNLDKIKKDVERRFTVDTQDWRAYANKPVSESAPIIARNIENAMAKLQNTTGKISVAYESPGGNGTFSQDLRVKDSARFKVPFIVVGDAPLACEVVANGTSRLVQYGPEWRDKSSVDSPLKDYTSLADPNPSWQRDFTQMVYQPLTHTPISWKSVINSWLNGEQGFRLTVEDRDLPLKLTDPKTGQVHTYDDVSFMLHAVRDAPAAAKYGRSEVEVVVDANRWLPTTIRSNYTDKSGKKNWKIMWTCDYHFRQQVTPSDYSAPFTAKIKSK